MPIIVPGAPSNPQGFNRQTAVRIEPVDGRLFISGAVVVADLAYLTWFRVSVPFATTAMEYFCVTAAGNVDMGIFSTTDFTNFTLLASTGATLAAGASAIQSINLTAGVTLVPGTDYYAAIVGNNATLSIAKAGTFQAMGTANRSLYQKAALDPLATFATPSGGSLSPWLAVK